MKGVFSGLGFRGSNRFRITLGSALGRAQCFRAGFGVWRTWAVGFVFEVLRFGKIELMVKQERTAPQ